MTFSIAFAATTCAAQTPAVTPPAVPVGMVLIAVGEFMMGSDDPESYPPERPAHRVQVDSYFIDLTEVTNEQFKAFTDATKRLRFGSLRSPPQRRLVK